MYYNINGYKGIPQKRFMKHKFMADAVESNNLLKIDMRSIKGSMIGLGVGIIVGLFRGKQTFLTSLLGLGGGLIISNVTRNKF